MKSSMKAPRPLAVFVCAILCSCLTSSTFAQDGTLTVTARGIGVDQDAAKKDALINAMQQAVGSFLDSETLIENDEIIRDEILSVSDGFVKRYDVTDGPSKRPDGLFEISIRAIVQQGKVQERLKSVRIISGSVAGKDAAAEVYTKITNADQGVQLLEKHLSGLLPKLLVARLVDENGKPNKQVRPITEIQEDRRIKCTWNIEVYFDLKAYYEQVAPQLDKIFRAISDGQPGQLVCVGKKHSSYGNYATNYPVLQLSQWRGDIPPENTEDKNLKICLSIGRDHHGENERFRYYAINKNLYSKVLEKVQQSFGTNSLHLYAMNQSNGVIREEIIPLTGSAFRQQRGSRLVECRPEFLLYDAIGRGYGSPSGLFVSPRFSHCSRDYFNGSREKHYSDTMLIPYSAIVNQSDLEAISGVKFQFK